VQTRVGLVTAINRYDPGRANSFVVYAVASVTGELERCLRDTSRGCQSGAPSRSGRRGSTGRVTP
jgi:DNA-directed RNA polymerase specialized sigma subunit